MSTQPRPRRPLAAARQRGQAMLLTVLLLGVGTAAVVYNFVTPATHSIERDRITAAALAQVREALIGWSAARTPSVPLPNARPGELPCPDANNDGFEDGACVAGAIGRVPWKTLGIPEPKDGSGETLWYAFSGSFRIWATNPNPINSDTAGQLTITGTTPANNVIAIIFAPGGVVGGQSRGTVVEQNTVANYLEGENSNGDMIYTTALATTTFNDQLLPITSDALFNVVNVRVAKEAIAALEAYRGPPGNNGYYPFANDYPSGAPYSCSAGLNRGRFPATTAGCGQAAWGGALPAWFVTNNWSLVTHYAMSKSCGELTGPLAILGPLLCGLAAAIPVLAPLLALLGFADEPIFVAGVTGANGARALVVVTGRAVGAQVHPCAAVGGCLEDAANADGNANYVKPSRFPASNDRMAICDNTGPCPIVP